ncbi:hypothetical protein D4R87_01220 [bacterium]|nr:MAG: hypothetical protein D4R87_01220 [bacterium]
MLKQYYKGGAIMEKLSSAINFVFNFCNIHRTWFWGSFIVVGFIIGIIIVSYKNDKAEEHDLYCDPPCAK